MPKPKGSTLAFKNQKQVQDWLYSLTPRIKKFYKEIFYNEDLKITKAVLIKHQIAKDILQSLLKGKMEKGEESGPVPVQIVFGKYGKKNKPKGEREETKTRTEDETKDTRSEKSQMEKNKEEKVLSSSISGESTNIK